MFLGANHFDLWGGGVEKKHPCNWKPILVKKKSCMQQLVNEKNILHHIPKGERMLQH